MDLLPIKAVCDLAGVNANTLRAWERRYATVEPVRTPAGRRLYTPEDVARLKLIVRLVERGYVIGQIATSSLAELKKFAARQAAVQRQSEPITRQAPQPRLQRECQEILHDLRRYAIEDIHERLTALRKSCDARLFVLEVASPLFQEVGRLVEAKKLSIAQEHALSALMRNHLTFLLSDPYTGPSQEKGIAFVTPEGERHEFGILLGSVLANFHGYRVYYLGPSLPASSVVEVSKALNCRLVVIGTTAATRHHARTSLGRFVKNVMDGAEQTDVWLGGPAELGPSVRFLPRPPILLPTFAHLDHALRQHREEGR